jgi:hypothetical protein
VARLELDQHVHVALRTEVVPEHRTEERQPTHVVALAEVGDGRPVDGELG